MSNGFLYMLGPLIFSTVPYEVHEVFHESSADFAAKDVIMPTSAGGAPQPRPREWMGFGDERIHMVGVTFPSRIIVAPGLGSSGSLALGGLTGPQTLQAMEQAGQAYMLARGDWTRLGYYFIERIIEHHSLLDGYGVGRVLDYEFYLVRAPDAQGSVNNVAVSQSIAASATPTVPRIGA